MPEYIPTIYRLSETPVDAETIMVYGQSGTGKTRFIGSVGNRVLIVNNGGGLKTLRSMQEMGVDPLVIDVLEKTSLRGKIDESTVHDMTCDALDYALTHRKDDFDVFAIDDGTELQQGVMTKAISFNYIVGKRSIDKSVATKYRGDAPEMNDYQQQMAWVAQFLSDYVKLAKAHNKHFIFAAHVRFTYKPKKKINEELGPPIAIAPFFTGVDKTPDIANKYFDHVWYFRARGGKERVYDCITQPNDIIAAKTRGITDVPPIYVNPTFPDALKKIRRLK